MELTLADNIRSFRKARNLTQEQLSEVLNVTAGAVYKWEAGLSVPELNLIVEMADFFDVSVDVLLGYRMRDNRPEAAEARLEQLAKSGDPAALTEAEKALKKYPNSFRIVFSCAEIYRIFGGGGAGKDKLRRAVELLEQARLLIRQSTDPKISEYTILGEIGNTLITLGETEKGLELLKKNNMNGIFNSDIGCVLAAFADRPGEAEEYLLEAILTGVGDLCSAAFGYAFVLLSRGDAASLREMIGWVRSLINGLFREAPAGVMHKVEMGTEILSAAAMLAEGQREAAREALRKAAEMAEAFDASPDYSLKALRFAALPENVMAWDSLGLTARESAETTLRLLKNKELEEMWKEVRKNA
ncbi:MAG: helix-turn-helix transcriptional regulator [Lachnospiraceae bacterium]|nr:helix-turn-helix transcriptional regulator [Lachnospiraceae bacterium]